MAPVTGPCLFQAFIPGVPRPQGSKKAYVVAGRARMAESGGADLKGWRASIASVVADALPEGYEPSREAVRVEAYFHMPRPLAHFRTNGELKEWAIHAEHVKTPDIDKLLRALLDGLAGVVFHDDRQVMQVAAEKRYGMRPGATVGVFVVPQ